MLNWIKNNKLATVLLLLVLVLGSQKLPLANRVMTTMEYGTGNAGISAPSRSMLGSSKIGGLDLQQTIPAYDAAPAPEARNRLVMQESYLSLLVKDVRETQNQILGTAESMGGYMVNTFLNNPQDAPTSTVTLRIPADRLNEALEQFRGLAVKVVSENLSGQDVTDQYVDNEARLATLEETKAKFQEIMNRATEIEDILRTQQEIINLQSQIDSVKGQQNYLEKNAQMARLTVYLSTDELALPYEPSETWRPAVIFKQAVRSLVGSFRKLGTVLIWLAVYSVVLLPLYLLFRFFRKKR